MTWPVRAGLLVALAGAGSAGAQQPEALECSVPRIAAIELVRHEIFEETEATPGIIRFVNKLHFSTREGVIRRELLFAVGEQLDPESLAQSERNLRATRFIAFARIEVRPVVATDEAAADEPAAGEVAADEPAAGEPVGVEQETPTEDDLAVEAVALYDPAVLCNLGADEVTVTVITRDAWTTSVDGSIGSAAGVTTWSLGVEEGNLFGLGKRVRLQHSTEIDRSYNTIAYFDPRLAGSRNQLLIEGSDQSDGGRFRMQAGRPWFAIDTAWSWGAQLDTYDQQDPLYENGERVDELHHVSQHQSVGGGFALSRDTSQALRLHFGARHLYDDVQVEVREFAILETGVSFTRHRFLKLAYLNHERPEDVPLGPELSATVGYGKAASDSDSRDAMFFNLGTRVGTQIGERRFTAMSTTWNGRLEDGVARNTILAVRAGVADGTRNRQLFLVRGRLLYGMNLDPEVQIRLGADTGLRGYPVNQFVGDRSLLLTAEYRRFLFDDVLRLVSLGVSAFVDSGYAWAAGDPMAIDDLRTSIGVGLLVGRRGVSTSSASMRFDLSYALDPLTGRSPWLASLGLITDLGF